MADNNARVSRVQDKNYEIRIGQLMLLWRQSNKLSVRRAAEVTGLDFRTLNRIERGNKPDGGTLARLLLLILENEQ